MAKTLMIQGTTSFAGKSFLVMSLCRIFADSGFKVAPFKSQNTSLNSFVTRNGEEISRAQALQALAAGVEPAVEMNPILIKPKGERRCQVIANGKPFRDMEAKSYYRFALNNFDIIEGAYRKLERDYDIVVIEGAGSPAEINLYDRDVANMRVAEMADSPVILTADIERGGVFASIFGTVSLVKEKHRKRIKGIVINKFRGDMEILKPGVKEIESRVRKPVLGVIPYIEGLKLPGEDSMSIESSRGGVDIVVIRLPRISNFTDFDPLVYEGAGVRYVEETGEVGMPNAIIIPGTKNTLEDLKWLKGRGFEKKLRELFGQVPLIGICGGYQILGRSIHDSGIEGGSRRSVAGLGMLDVETWFERYKKTTRRVSGVVAASSGVFKGMRGKKITGYEIHMGNTTLGKNVKPAFALGAGYDGAFDTRHNVLGTYIHGIFDSAPFRRAFLKNLALVKSLDGTKLHSCAKDLVLCSGQKRASRSLEVSEIWEASIKRAAEAVSRSLDMEKVRKMMGV